MKPSEFMRARRPELFSDSVMQEKSNVERSFLDYHLQTLTSRKQEQAFEEFCRRLAELTICPNLKPQTGPTGGGDSKTDASTYPVAPVLADRCYWGLANPPSGEEWAFAFSAKKKWKEKLYLDMEGISKQPRKFAKAYFISNQYIKDKARASLEAELSAKHGFDVHILDKTWILNKIINDRLDDVAIQILGIGSSITKKPLVGPRDSSRTARLEEISKKLARPDLYQGNDYALIEDYIEAGLLARSTGGSRESLETYFLKARSLANKCGNKGQAINAGYYHAWTLFWWFDDTSALARIYSEIEPHALNTDDAEDCELLANLLILLIGEKHKGATSINAAKVEEHLTVLRKELTRLVNDTHRLNNSLHAETELYILDLIEEPGNEKKAKITFDNLAKCLNRCAGLGQYPAQRFINTLTELGEFLGELKGYDDLFNEMSRTVNKRFGEVSEGKLLYSRGLQQLRAKRYKDALLSFSKARPNLWKEETLELGIRSALGCCDAYTGIGLYWAARMEGLLAAHAAMCNPKSLAAYPAEAAEASIRMAWLELKLGRIAPILSWIQLCVGNSNHLSSLGFDTEDYQTDLLAIDGSLGCLLLQLPEQNIQSISQIDIALDELGLHQSKLALAHRLGKIDSIVQGLPEELKATGGRENYFAALKEAFSETLTVTEDYTDQEFCSYRTVLLGVEYIVRPKNQFGPITYAENLLGIIEAAFALARWTHLALVVDQFTIGIDECELGTNPPLFDFLAPADDRYKLIWGSDMITWLHSGNRKQVLDHFMEFLLQLLLCITIDPLEDLKAELNRWHREHTFSRAMGNSPTSLLVLDLLGKERYGVGHWSKSPTTP